VTVAAAPRSAARGIRAALERGVAVPYLGPGVLSLAGDACALPASPLELVARLTAKTAVPHKIRTNLTAAAQFIENFKHRKTVSAAMTAAFAGPGEPTALHAYLAALPALPLIVHAWYDDLPQRALAAREDWGVVQGVSQAEHFGTWVHYFAPDGTPVTADRARRRTLLYQPFGSVSPAANYLVSDSDFVEVLTEIDIQTPIPEPVIALRTGRHFVFLGCRFATQLDRIFAHQIMKRSSSAHWAVFAGEPTRNEARFMAGHGIEHVDLSLHEFLVAMSDGDTSGR